MYWIPYSQLSLQTDTRQWEHPFSLDNYSTLQRHQLGNYWPKSFYSKLFTGDFRLRLERVFFFLSLFLEGFFVLFCYCFFFLFCFVLFFVWFCFLGFFCFVLFCFCFFVFWVFWVFFFLVGRDCLFIYLFIFIFFALFYFINLIDIELKWLCRT